VPQNLAIDLLDATGSLHPRELDALGSKLRQLATLLCLHGTLEVRCINDAEMTAAHARFLHDATTTDVMTFDNLASQRDASKRLTWRVETINDDRPRLLDATLLVCVDEGRRRAREHALSVETELLLYCTHGILHCLGWDDDADDEFAAMHAFEDTLLTAIGVGTVFAKRADKTL
jgi:probable rRNA maturation factor